MLVTEARSDRNLASLAQSSDFDWHGNVVQLHHQSTLCDISISVIREDVLFHGVVKQGWHDYEAILTHPSYCMKKPY